MGDDREIAAQAFSFSRFAARLFEDFDLVRPLRDFAGEVRVIQLSYLPDLQIGDYTIVHAGFALTRLSEEEAEKTIRLMRETGVLERAG